MSGYLIAREADDSIVTGIPADSDDDAERKLGEMSMDTPGSLLLLRDQKLMAWAHAGVVFSYRPESRSTVAA